MSFETRSNCVICNSLLNEFQIRKNYPLCMYHTSESTKDDIYYDQTFGACISCGCIQLMNLYDPAVIYKQAHNETFNTPTWKEHHRAFSMFVMKKNPTSTILEIGGNPGLLPKLLPDFRFKIMNICMPVHSDHSDASVEFVQGNCEEYTFTNENDVVMSHVFEHLYNPRKFVENVAKAKVKKVIISIPNMDAVFEKKPPLVLHTEHTFFINTVLLTYIFNSYKYVCTSFEAFKNHSYFYCFEYDETIVVESIPKLNITEKYTRFLEDFECNVSKLKDVNIDFIVPGGHYGQTLHYFLQRNITGFLDNDPSKQDLRLYGTDIPTFSMKKLSEYNDDDEIAILIYAGVYTDELIDQIKRIHPKCKIFTLF